MPGIYALRTTLRIPVPNDPNLLGAELYCWPTTAPVAGQTHVPALNLPRGAHLTIIFRKSVDHLSCGLQFFPDGIDGVSVFAICQFSGDPEQRSG